MSKKWGVKNNNNNRNKEKRRKINKQNNNKHKMKQTNWHLGRQSQTTRHSYFILWQTTTIIKTTKLKAN